MKFVFDTEVILKFYLGEKGADKVSEHLEKVAGGEDEGYMNYVNLAEFYYILYRKNQEAAEEKLNNLISFGVKTIDVKDNWKMAAKIKAEKSIPLGDAFAAATALSLGALLLAGGDSDFEDLNIKIGRV